MQKANVFCLPGSFLPRGNETQNLTVGLIIGNGPTSRAYMTVVAQ